MRAIVICSLLLAASSWGKSMASGETTVWIGMGAAAHGEREGIYSATLNPETGDLSQPKLAAEIGDPEFLAVHPNGKRLYAGCRLDDNKPGVAAYEITDDGRALRFLNSQPNGGDRACHVATDRSGRCLFTAQYGSGTVSAFPLDSNGEIKPRTEYVRHSGSGPDRQRQEGPHTHAVYADPSNRFLLVPDLGTDKVVIYEMDLDEGKLKPHREASVPPGGGPRHLAFDPAGRFVYVLNEMAISVTTFEYDAEKGTLKKIETVDSLPADMRELPSSAAEICMHPSGNFVFASTRGHDSVSAFRIDQKTGRLRLIEREPVRGAHPRSCNLDPSGKWLLAAGRDSNTIAVFGIDPQSGSLVFTGKIVSSPTPICIEFSSAK